MNRHLKTMLPLAVSAAVMAGCSDGTSERDARIAELQGQRRTLLLQFSSTQNAIRGIQVRALQEPGVQAAQDTFNARLRAVVQRDDPESVALLDRAEVVGRELQQLSVPVLLQQGQDDPRLGPEERAQLASDLAETERALRPVIDRAFEDAMVVEAFGALRDSVMAAMLRMDPSTQVSMDLMAEIEGQVAEIDAEIASLSGE
jgi:pimeloyl-ACP methyl ester carboxylesterase